MAYWFNIETRQVEDDDNRSPGENVMGPYETREEAASALETARQKTEAWDEEDRRYENEGFEDSGA
ncbi:MAG: methionine aminopeptidase [Micrococcales bacterium]|nr:methionine aminopeptidase [Micrococcales bacterium]